MAVVTVTSKVVSEVFEYSKEISSKHLPSNVAEGFVADTSAAKTGKKAPADAAEPPGSRSPQVYTGLGPLALRFWWNSVEVFRNCSYWE